MRRLEPIGLEQREIDRVPPRRPVGNVTLRYCSRKAVRMRNGPVGEDSATAAPRHAEFLLVDVATLEEFVDSDHQVSVVVTGVVVLNDVSELLAITGRAARVDVENNIAFGGHPLKFMIEDPAVGSVWTAMNVEDKRVLLLRVEVGRLLNPPLNTLSVEARVIDFLGCGQIESRPELPVEIDNTSLGPF